MPLFNLPYGFLVLERHHPHFCDALLTLIRVSKASQMRHGTGREQANR